MLKRKLMILAIILICLLSVSAAGAAENASDESLGEDLNVSQILAADDSDFDENVVSAPSGVGTFTELNELIRSTNSNVSLQRNYAYFEDSDHDLADGITFGGWHLFGNGFTIDGLGQARIFNVDRYAVFHDLNFVNARSDNGGAIMGACEEGFTVYDSNFTSNHADAAGGAIYNGHAVDCIFKNNSAELGGAIYLGAAEGCTFEENSATMGGAVYDVYAIKSEFVRNSAGDSCGAMYNNSAVDCTFIENTANNRSGALGFGYAVRCSFIENDAFEGGAIANKAQAIDCAFEGNTADKGGAAFDSNAEWCNFTNNHARDGGAIYDGVSSSHCRFTNNSADEFGGALYGTYTDNSEFESNSADFGGAISSGSSASNSNFVSNTARISGGAKFDSYVFNCTYDGKLPRYTLYCDDFKAIEGYGGNINVKMYDAPGYYVDGESIIVNVFDDTGRLVKTYYAQTGYNLFIDMGAGSYRAVISSASDGYEVNSINISMTVQKMTFIYAADVSTVYDGGKYILATLRDSAGNPIDGVIIVIKLNGRLHNLTTDGKGQVSLSTDGLLPGRYPSDITFAGDDIRLPSTTSVSVVVASKGASKIFLRNALYFVLQTKMVQVTLWDENNTPLAGKRVYIRFDEYTWSYSGVTDLNGNAFIKVGIGFGVHPATVSFEGDDDYAAFSRTGYVRVIKETPSLMLPGKYAKFKASDATKTVKIYLKDRYNKPLLPDTRVFIKVNGQTYAGQINSEGIASINININAAGTYNAELIYMGNTAYNKVTRQTKITIV